MKIKDTQYTIFDIDDIKEFNKCSFEECNDAINKVLNEYGKNAYNIWANTLIYIIEKERYINNNIGNEKSQEYIDVINGYNKIIDTLKHQLLKFNKNIICSIQLIDLLNTFEKKNIFKDNR